MFVFDNFADAVFEQVPGEIVHPVQVQIEKGQVEQRNQLARGFYLDEIEEKEEFGGDNGSFFDFLGLNGLVETN